MGWLLTWLHPNVIFLIILSPSAAGRLRRACWLPGRRDSVSHHDRWRSWTHARRWRSLRRATNGAQHGASALCLIFRLLSYYRPNVDECLWWYAERRQPSSNHIRPAVLSGKFVSTRCQRNVIIRPIGCQLTLKIRTSKARRSDCRLDHYLVLALQPDRWNVNGHLTMMNAVCCRSSVSHTTSTVLHVGAVAERMLPRPISRNAAYANQTMFDALFRPSMIESFERFSLHATSTTTFDQRSTGYPIQMLRGTARRRGYDSSIRKKRDVDFGCPRHRATWSPHHVRWNGRRRTSQQRQSVDSSSEHNRKTTADEPVAGRRKLMNGRDGIEDRRLFNAGRMLMTTTYPVVASWIILMIDGRVSFTVVHQSSPEHWFLPVKGEGKRQRHRVRWWNTTTAIVAKIGLWNHRQLFDRSDVWRTGACRVHKVTEMATRTRRCDHRLLAVHGHRSRDRHQLEDIPLRPCQRRSCLSQHQSGRSTAKIVETRVAIQAMTLMTKRDPANEIEIDSRTSGNIVSTLRREWRGEIVYSRWWNWNVTTEPHRLSRFCRSFTLAFVITTWAMKTSRFSFGVCLMGMQTTCCRKKRTLIISHTRHWRDVYLSDLYWNFKKNGIRRNCELVAVKKKRSCRRCTRIYAVWLHSPTREKIRRYDRRSLETTS